MKQINFRLTDEEYQIVKELAKILGKSVPTLLKELGMREINAFRPRLALDLYHEKTNHQTTNYPFCRYFANLVGN